MGFADFGEALYAPEGQDGEGVFLAGQALCGRLSG
jgi:hypothetical protein